MSNRVEMEILPKCDFCQSYPKWGVDKLGTGYGQKLIKGVK